MAALRLRPDVQMQRWLPIPVLLALPTGYVIKIVALSHGAHCAAKFGGALAGCGLLVAILLHFLWPRLYPTFGKRLDERELQVKRFAYTKSGNLIALVAITGCLYFGLALDFGWWAPTRSDAFTGLGMMLLGWYWALPMLIAGWHQAPSFDGEDV